MSRRLTGAERAQAKVDRHNAKTWFCSWPGCEMAGQPVAYDPKTTNGGAELRRHHDMAGHSAQPNNRLTRGRAA